MRSVKHEVFPYNESVYLASLVISEFYSNYPYMDNGFTMFLECEKDRIPMKLAVSSKVTVLHLFIEWNYGNVRSIYDTLRDTDYDESYLEAEEKNISLFATISLPRPGLEHGDDEECTGYGNCEICTGIREYTNHLESLKRKAVPYIIHSAFHIIMLNKAFLVDFHTRLGQWVLENHDFLNQTIPSFITKAGKIKRMSNWPAWLKKGIFFRDKGVCTICRNPLSGDLFLGIDPDMDHIVPLSLYGTNDPSNIQILCNVCNNSKRDYSSATSFFDIPYWNLEDDNELI
ncbi:hypothetical protein A3848_09560 [Paenibacillus sp. P32E]|nr:hypothetical protein A3848_09560 [Paenibacillus sp. P32E]